MQNDKLSQPASPKLSSGYSAFFYIPFFALFIFDVLSGYYLFVHRDLDFYKLFFMKAHVVAGFFSFALFLFLSLIHLKRLYRLPLIFFTFLAAFSFYILCALEAHPPSAFAFFVAVNALLAWRYLLGNPPVHRTPVISGVIAWALFNLIFATGLAMAGPMKSFRTDMFNVVHQWVSVGLTPLLFYHLLFRQDTAFSWKKGAAILTIMGINVWLFFPAHKQAKWFQTRRVQIAQQQNHSDYTAERLPGGKFSLQNAKTCGEIGCHTEIYKEWEASSHRFSASSLLYKKVLALFVKETGDKDGAFCERCHNPDVVIFPEESKHPAARKFFTQQGISCLSCHLISESDVEIGNGFKKIQRDAPYLPGFHPETKSEWEMLHAFIRSDLRQHRKNYQRRPMYQSPEYCDTCHRITVPAAVNGAKPFVFKGPYASWSSSRYAKEGITCQHCHMQLFEFKDPQSMEREMHARPDHRTFGINATLAFNVGKEAVHAPSARLKDFSVNTEKWLKGTLWVSTYEQTFLRYVRDGRAAAFDNYFYNKPFLGMDIGYKKPAAGTTSLSLIVKTRDIRGGHDFPVSLIDMADVWLEIRVTDANGKTIFQSGMLDKNYFLPPDTHRLGGTLVDKNGKPIERHRVWLTAGIKNKRVIPPLGEVEDVYAIKLPSKIFLPLKVRARWLYRRVNQDLANWLFNDKEKTFPVIEVASGEKVIKKH